MSRDTRERIVEAARRLFWEKGYGSTSVADILQAAGANSGSLYHFFPGKQDILLSVLETYRDGIEPMLLEPAWRDISDPIERVFALLARYRQMLVDTDCFYGCPIGSLALELHEPDPAVRERLADNFAAWTVAVKRCFDDADARLPADLNRHALARLVLTTMEGGVMLSRTDRNLEAYDAAVGQLRRYIELLRLPARDRRVRRRSATG